MSLGPVRGRFMKNKGAANLMLLNLKKQSREILYIFYDQLFQYVRALSLWGLVVFIFKILPSSPLSFRFYENVSSVA